MAAVREQGFEVGIHCYNHYRWQDYLATMLKHWHSLDQPLYVEPQFHHVFGPERRRRNGDALHHGVRRVRRKRPVRRL